MQPILCIKVECKLIIVPATGCFVWRANWWRTGGQTVEVDLQFWCVIAKNLFSARFYLRIRYVIASGFISPCRFSIETAPIASAKCTHWVDDRARPWTLPDCWLHKIWLSILAGSKDAKEAQKGGRGGGFYFPITAVQVCSILCHPLILFDTRQSCLILLYC
jgi:hypothetical protein